MKKAFLLKSFMLLCMLMTGMGAWAETYTITFLTNTSDGSTTIAANTQVSNVVSAGASYVSGFTSSCSKAYLKCINGVKLGSSSANGTLEFNIATNYQSNIKSITVKSTKYGSDTGTITLYSGSNSLKTGITPGTDYTHTFTTATTVSSIKLSTSAKRAYISEIVLETDGGGGSNVPVDASWSVDPTSVNVKATKTATATITTDYNGTLSVSSANSSVATASINGKVITVSGVAEGSTTLTVTGAATSAYNAISKTIDITVTANVRPTNEIFYESFDTNDGTGGNDDQWSGNIASNNIKQDNDGWVFENGSGAKECAKFGAGSKLGTATTPAIAASGNFTLTFKAAAWNGNSESTTLKLSATGATLSASSVTLTKGAWDTYNVNITNATEGFKIKFAGNSSSNSRFFLDEVSIVSVAPTSTDVTISAAGYATFFDAEHAYVMPDDCEGYVFTAANGLELAYKAEEVVPAGEPLVIYTIEPGTKTLTFTTSAEDTYKSGDMNDLCGAATDMTAVEMAAANAGMGKFYALSLNAAGETSSVGFYWVEDNGAAFAITAGKAYLALPGSTSAKSFRFIGETTGINNVNTSSSAQAQVYNLAGQRVNANVKGIVIVNGRKVLNK